MQVAGDTFGSGWGIRNASAGRRSLAGWWVAALVVVLLAGQVARALEILTTDGHLYQGCSITQVEPDGLRILHRDGAARIPYEKLLPTMQKQYFDPVKVAAFHAQVAEAQRVAAVKAGEEQRARAIAAAKAQEIREAEETAQPRVEEEQDVATERTQDLKKATEQRKGEMGKVLAVVAGVLAIFIYFLPTLTGRKKINAVAIFAFNLFLGWTFVGWVVALVWACTKDSAMDLLARQHLNMPPRAPQPRPLREYDGRRLGDARQVEDGRFLE